MDPLDIKILRKLRTGGSSEFDPFPTGLSSLRHVASELDIDKDTVRNRITRLRGQGVFLGWSAMINPNLLSLKVQKVWLEFPDKESRDRGIKELSKTSNVRTIILYLGQTVSFVFAHEEPEALNRYLQKFNDEVGRFTEIRRETISFPECTTNFSGKDRSIYSSIRDSFQRPQTDIAMETGVSLRTVKRRLGTLTDKNALLILTSWDASKVEGVPIEIYFTASSQKALKPLISNISEKFDDSLLLIETYVGPSVNSLFICKNVAAAEDIFQYVRSQDDITIADFHLIRGAVRVRDKLRLNLKI